MLKNVINRKDIVMIFLLAIYNFCFLGTEFFFDDMMALLTNSAGVVNAQNIVLGVSFIGVIVYPVFCKYLSDIVKRIISVMACIISIVCVFVIMQHQNYTLVMGAGIVCFVILGVAGSAVCYITNINISNRKHLAKMIGIAYALGVFIQYIYTNFVNDYYIKAIVFSLFMIAFICGMHIVSGGFFEEDTIESQKSKEKISFYKIKPDNPKIVVGALIVCVALMTIIFSTLDNAVTLVHASGDYNIGQWARLLLAVSGLAAGFIYDIKGRCFMPFIMFLVTVMSVASIIIITMGGPFIIGLSVFYISAGFFVVFFMTSFMDISFMMKNPRLWAGMGRGLNNVCAILLTFVSTYLLEQDSQIFILIFSLVLFVMITCTMIAYYVPYFVAYRKIGEAAIKEDILKNLPKDANMEKIDAFAEAYALTEQEKKVVIQLLTNKEGVNSMIEQLYISRSTFYRYVDKLCDKTNTSSRKEFFQFFHDWEIK